ncbi:Oleandomycin glycosyltransferase [bioreactor metagenome]|uniref:Oleandomycin glycosyltransferase n=1 Tax=bioreactor metagenome TaxID=1076179 RepID=A0A644ZHE8_9ZZZZ
MRKVSKIAFFSIPAYGHTNPTLEVVKELVSRGNQVRYYAYHAQREKIESTGASFISCDDYDIQMHLSPEDGERLAKDIAFSTQLIVKMTLAMDDTIIREMAQWSPQCIVADSMATWGKLAAWKLGVPLMCSTTTFAFNRYSSKIMKQTLPQTFRMLCSMPKANRYVKLLRDKGYPVKNVLSLISNDNDTNTIVYTSAKFQPCAETFSDKYTFVGPSIKLPQSKGLKPHRTTVYISLGTVNNLKADFYRNCMEALGDANMDVVLSVGENIDPKTLGAVPDNFTAAPSVNQIEILQNADVFLTHCGMNSVNEALYCGVPLVLFPQTPEQSGVAYRVNELGAGMYLPNDSPQAIRETILAVLKDGSYKLGAKEISDDFHQCGGYRLAADKIESLIESSGHGR